MNKLELLITIALVLCVLFISVTAFFNFNLPWLVVFFSGNAVNTIVSLILGFCVAYLVYNENQDDER